MKSINLTMTHALLIALLNNQNFTPFTPFTYQLNMTEVQLKMNEIQQHEVVQKFLEFTNYFTETLTIYMIEIINKMNELVKSNDHIANILLLFIIITLLSFVTMLEYRSYNDNIQEILDQIQYLKKKSKGQEFDLEYALDCNTKNDIKMNKLIKQIKRLQREIKKYE
jgi:hypothetical protein